MILISGASGKTGKAILKSLVQQGLPVRAWVRDEKQRETMSRMGAAEVFVGDLREPSAWRQAVQGVKSVYFIAPNMSPDEDLIGKTAILASQKAELERFVYHSVLHPQVQAMPHHWLKLRVEEQLFKSDLAFTILQPAAYMQNVLGYWKTMQEEGRYQIPYSITSKSSMVNLFDLAEVATKVLTEPGHAFATYELCGRLAYSAVDIAEIVSEQTGLAITAEVQDRGLWEKRVRAGGMTDYAVDTLLKMFNYYESYDFIGNGMVLSWLLGREPASFKNFVNQEFVKK